MVTVLARLAAVAVVARTLDGEAADHRRARHRLLELLVELRLVRRGLGRLGALIVRGRGRLGRVLREEGRGERKQHGGNDGEGAHGDLPLRES